MRRSALSISWLVSGVLASGTAFAAPPVTSAASTPAGPPAAPGATTKSPANAAAAKKPSASPAPSVTPARPATSAVAPTPGSPAGSIPDRSSVVLVEQAGKAVGLGTLLNGDGRIVTALSRLNEKTPVFVRYAGGNLEPARVASADRTRDLALLVPKTARIRTGAKASRAALPSADQPLFAFGLQPNRGVNVVGQTLKRASTSAPAGLTELSTPVKPSDAGGPLLDARGEAVAVLVGGCAGAGNVGSCGAPPLALPVAEVRAFLRALPADAALNVPWLGAEGVRAETAVVRGVRITRLDPISPAAKAGLRAHARGAPGDVIAAVGWEPTPNPDALRNALSQHAPGERVELLIFNGTYRVLAVRLAERPAGPAPIIRLQPGAQPGAPAPAAPPAAGVKSE